MTTPTGIPPHLFKLGKLAPKHDPRTLALARYLDVKALPPVPAAKNWSPALTALGMMANDRLGDCTCAAVGHAVQVVTANNGSQVTIPDSDIIAAYSAVSGYDPRTGANDNGAYVLDVLNLWHKTGVGGHTLGAFAQVDVHRHDLVAAAIDLFAVVDIGLALPISAQAQVGGIWDVPSGGAHGNGAPGSWGGHSVTLVDYDAYGPTCITWGALQKMTWAFWDAYVDEAYACLAPEWLNGTNAAPSGFNLAQLQNDLADVSGQPEPNPTPNPPPQPPAPPAPPNPPTPPADWKARAEAAIDPVIAGYQRDLQRDPRSYTVKAKLSGARAARAAVDAATP